MLFTRTQEDKLICSNSNSSVEVPLARSDVEVPSVWELHIKLDLYIEIPNGNNEKLKHFDVTLTLGKKNTSTKLQPKGTGIEVEVKPTWCHNQEQLRPQLTSPVQIERTAGHQLEVVSTIGDDVMSFTEFVMAQRRILADHPGQEDILDGHHFLNRHSTREHPLLPKYDIQPERWLHVKLKAVDPKNKTSSWTTTLVMRSANLYH
ncbi:hypothetical protein PVAP13_8NG216600 [Panicum virgatum]|uniref:Uncharacterized protein n=1 Tax=Panicum virgatum TaxID=38727 RepID=A0A8T0PBG8_PANVG|nr:hypothetical protein PVAP13_8NG216600 [Panicum virgatum]